MDNWLYSEYDHAEIMQCVMPFIRSKVELIPMLDLDSKDMHLQKFRFGGIGSCFYQEYASYIDKIIKFWEDTNERKCTKLYYYAGDRLPTAEKPDEYVYWYNTFYVGMK